MKPISKNIKKNQLNNRPSFRDRPDWLTRIPYSYFSLTDLTKVKSLLFIDLEKISKNLNHYFDLLGSGFVSLKYVNVKTINDLVKYVQNGWINSANLSNTLKILRLIDQDYSPINWQIDFKSNIGWKTNEISDEIQYGNIENADIKIPWELARFNDLVYLSLCCSISDDELLLQKVLNEFRNRILDFIAMNPPKYGVNWINAMEVGIRAVNWLIAYDVLTQTGVHFDEAFTEIFISSLYSHYDFLTGNLEWSSGMRGNHYFSNIVSLLIISAFLPISEESSKILIFSINELIEEVFYQFNPDGTNFEGSTYYHCFVLEMLIYALYFASKLPNDKVEALSQISKKRVLVGTKFSKLSKQNFTINNSKVNLYQKFWDRLFKIFRFTDKIILNDGSSINIGDSDNGRYVKLSSENYLWLKNLINAVLNENNVDEGLSQFPENIILKELVQEFQFKFNNLDKSSTKTDKSLNKYEDFGLFSLENESFSCFFRCGSLGQKGKGGHAHNDQLSIILIIEDLPVLIDSGTYVYTGNHDLRNLFRSTEMHNTLSIQGLEQNHWDTGNKDELFWLRDVSKAKVINIGESSIEGIHYGYGKPTRRRVDIDGNTIRGEDSIDLEDFKTINFHINPCVQNINLIENNTVALNYHDFSLEISTDTGEIKIEDSLFSPSYGVIEKNKKVMIITQKNKINWKITLKK